jgi:hypothetical protein
MLDTEDRDSARCMDPVSRPGPSALKEHRIDTPQHETLGIMS